MTKYVHVNSTAENIPHFSFGNIWQVGQNNRLKFLQRFCSFQAASMFSWILLLSSFKSHVTNALFCMATKPSQLQWSLKLSSSGGVSVARGLSLSLTLWVEFPISGQQNKMSYSIPNKEKITQDDTNCQLLWFEMPQTSISSKCFVFEFSLT